MCTSYIKIPSLIKYVEGHLRFRLQSPFDLILNFVRIIDTKTQETHKLPRKLNLVFIYVDIKFFYKKFLLANWWKFFFFALAKKNDPKYWIMEISKTTKILLFVLCGNINLHKSILNKKLMSRIAYNRK